MRSLLKSCLGGTHFHDPMWQAPWLDFQVVVPEVVFCDHSVYPPKRALRVACANFVLVVMFAELLPIDSSFMWAKVTPSIDSESP